MSALLLLDPAPLPEGLDIPAADWQQTPTSVRHHFLFLLKRVDRRPPIPPQKNAPDGRQLLSAASLEPNLAILAIPRCSWSRPHRCRCCPIRVPVASRGSRISSSLTRIRSLNYPLFIRK